MQPRARFLIGCALAVVLMLVPMAVRGVEAQPAEQTATQFYLSYKAAFARAKKLDELFPYMSRAKVSEMETLPAAERPKAFEMIKDMYVFSNEKVVKETNTATGATLEVEAIDPDKKKYRATVTLVRENNAWKLQEEDWSPAK